MESEETEFSTLWSGSDQSEDHAELQRLKRSREGVYYVDEMQVVARYYFEDISYNFYLDSVHVAFTDGHRIKSRSCVNRWMNKAVICFTQKYTHSEIAFCFICPNGPDGCRLEQWVACAIYGGGKLEFIPSTARYTSPVWQHFKCDLTDQQMSQLYQDCCDDVSRGLYFNNWVYVNFFLPRLMKRDRKLERAWCSEHVSARLKSAGVEAFQDTNPYTIDPLDLFEKVKTLNTTMEFNPHMMQSLLEAIGRRRQQMV